MRRSLYTCLLAIVYIHAAAQIHFNNPSFEEEPADATTPMGWFECTEGTTPDILPGYWGVYNEASEGNTFVGIITRDNGTWESIGQRFSVYLKEKDCYEFTVDLAHSDTYSGYNETLKLRIWISNEKCGRAQLVFESPFIEHTEWKRYPVQFSPEHDANYIFIEAFYKYRHFSRRGNILVDNLSPILQCGKT